MNSNVDELVKKTKFDINDLVDIVVILRSENGCPWDKVQTHSSIKNDFLEEVYEVIEAIDCNSPEMMREELGDVLLQVVFHTVIETENKHFGLDEVTTDICKKLIIRHPHVFGNVKADTVDDVLKNWDSIKKKTKGQENYTQTLKSVPKTFPALMKAQKLGKRASRAMADFDTNQKGQLCAWENVNNSTNHLHETIECGDSDEQKAALGDMLFNCCNLARAMGIDAEQALADSCANFVDKFEKLEKTKGNLSDVSVGELYDCKKINE